jgi:hypothetical protein
MYFIAESLGLGAVSEIEATVFNLAAHYHRQFEAVFSKDLACLCETILFDLSLHFCPVSFTVQVL